MNCGEGKSFSGSVQRLSYYVDSRKTDPCVTVAHIMFVQYIFGLGLGRVSVDSIL